MHISRLNSLMPQTTALTPSLAALGFEGIEVAGVYHPVFVAYLLAERMLRLVIVGDDGMYAYAFGIAEHFAGGVKLVPSISSFFMLSPFQSSRRRRCTSCRRPYYFQRPRRVEKFITSVPMALFAPGETLDGVAGLLPKGRAGRRRSQAQERYRVRGKYRRGRCGG